MKIKKNMGTHWLLWTLVLLMALPAAGIMAQGTDSGGQMTFRQEELDQMLAPIALYPDDLLSQVLMSATYPLEVVEAARWIQANPNLRGDQLAAALEQRDWDPSVKSMVNFPDILQMMNDKLEWTEMVGDAFLAQEDQVMDTVQMLREKAQAQGSLRTTSELRVIPDPQTQAIIIEPADPQVYYVPVYDPMIVFGPWWWPAYPPFYYHPRRVINPGRFIGFGFGVPIGVPWGYAWGGCDWHRHTVVVNISRNVTINNRIDRNRYASHVTTGSSGRGIWTHDPDHRRGIAYRTPAIARQFGRGPLPGADARRGFRGYDRPVTGGTVVPRSNRPEGQQPRVTTGPNVARPESFRQPSAPGQQPRVTPSPGPARPESLRQQPVPAQEPRVTPVPRVARPEPSRQLSTPVQQPPVSAKPMPVRPEMQRQMPVSGHQGVQGLQSPTAFGGIAPGGQTRRDSQRGHESLSGPRSPGPGPVGNKPAPGGGHPGGGPAHERGK
ncbi:MAG: DUF3300 domain-containing protein [Thermodesulfobacteriota bacterium]